MAHDIVIRGGNIVDGTGSEPSPGDVGIDGGVITAVGKIDGKGKREIDARGQMVTPGFVDIHTHLDAQIGWDPECTPVSWHGVTTALLGNCGVTFAPCRPGDKGTLAAMMETVEDIPRNAILTGLSWDWEDYGGYLNALEKLRPGINIAGLVGHSALRYYVMGERGVEEQATADERRQMAEIVGRSIDAGAVGFSTNRFEPHKLPDGRSIPGTFADPIELIDIARAVAPRKGLVQAVGASIDVLKSISDDGGARVLCSYGAGPDMATATARRSALDQLCRGRDITAISQVRSSGLIFTLQSLIPGRGPSWTVLRKQGLAERLAALDNPQTFATLVEEAKHEGFTAILGTGVEKIYYMGIDASPNYVAGEDMSLLKMAQAAGEHWAETFLRLSRDSRGKAMFTLRMFNADMNGLAHMFASPNSLPSLGDAGAHVSQIMDAGWASFVLSYWVRQRGLFTMGQAIRKLTSAPARVIGLTDRGVIAPGMRADLNVFDAAKVVELQPSIVNDFPGGAPRFVQRASGYKATLVNGEVNLVDGELTGARAGKVLRHAARAMS